ncbi:MAG: transketolase family protein [Nanoarchaeota archaeon]|nr:transketolase family protein [Nanoarchaeota archaeon]MBU1632401.1 transketolase family protein [Nanoarchaeota archaeon]MBU1875861.1 transketolase family protein [Nanoarchaeota archaeon]
MNLDFFRQHIPTRNGYGDALVQIGVRNKNIVVLCADLTESIRVEKFREKFPERFVEVGVAEQNLVTIASGLAAVGKIPFASSYAMFCPGRCWEQIRTTICYNNQNVKIIGAHAGVSVGPDGATHQALEDIAIVRCIPNIIVIVPADYEQTKKATKAIAKHKGPAYLRLTREKTEQMTTIKTPFEIGKAQIWKDGKDIAFIAAGPVIHQCLTAAEMLEKKNIKAMVINSHTIKPLDEKTILAAAKKCKRIITVEEAQIIGGLGSAVTEFLSEAYPTKIKRIGVRDLFGESGDPDELLMKFGFSTKHIFDEAIKLMK